MLFSFFRIENITEFDCFVKSFYYLATKLPVGEFLEPFNEEATVEPLAYIMEQMKTAKSFETQSFAHVNFDIDEFKRSKNIGRSMRNLYQPLAR